MLRVALSLAIVVIVGLLLNFAGSITRPGWLAASRPHNLRRRACLAGAGRGAQRPRPPRAGPSPRAFWRASARRHIDGDCAGGWPRRRGNRPFGTFLQSPFTNSTTRNSGSFRTKTPQKTSSSGCATRRRTRKSYAVELLVDRHLVQSWSEVPLKPGETWTTTFRWAGFGEYPRAVQPLRKLTTSEEAAQGGDLGAGRPRRQFLASRRLSTDRTTGLSSIARSGPPRNAQRYENAHGRPPCEF